MKLNYLIVGLLMISSVLAASKSVVTTKEAQKKVKIIPITMADKTHVFAFEENPSTGYLWQFKIKNKKIIAIKRGDWITNSTDEQIVGATGTRSFTIRAIKPGTTKVTFTYARPWENKEPAETKIYKITVMP